MDIEKLIERLRNSILKFYGSETMEKTVLKS